tara:strand:+ start:15806 stop:16558 length:753 start_codon:yes stop_codon:yes gene_type:complete
MSTGYFLFSKLDGNEKKIDDNSSVSVFQQPSENITYLLPKNLMGYYVENGLFESQLIEWSKQFLQDTGIFLDIGAHTGSWALSLASLAQHVYAFEPQKMTYYALCGGVALSGIRNVTCINKGLGSNEQVGTRTLRIVSNDGGGSTIQPTNYPILDEEKIEIITLDSMNLKKISLIKMDVEQNELEVLKGSKETLERSNYPPIVFECNEAGLELNSQHELFIFLVRDLDYLITPITGVKNMFLAYKDLFED